MKIKVLLLVFLVVGLFFFTQITSAAAVSCGISSDTRIPSNKSDSVTINGSSPFYFSINGNTTFKVYNSKTSSYETQSNLAACLNATSVSSISKYENPSTHEAKLSWTCMGSNGTTASCSALAVIDGKCNPSPASSSGPNGGTYASIADFQGKTLCTAGYCAANGVHYDGDGSGYSDRSKFPGVSSVDSSNPSLILRFWWWVCCGYNNGINDICYANKQCSDSSWSPDPSRVCFNQKFTQTSNCGNTRQASGTWRPTTWTPDPSQRCEGTTFTQTTGCETRTVQGTANLATCPTLEFTADPTIINPNGSTKLTWTTTNTVSCVASHTGGTANWNSSSKSINGSQDVFPTSSATTYTLICKNNEGVPVEKSVTVYIRPTLDFNTNKTNLIKGESATLSWASTSSDYCVASNGWSWTRNSNLSKSQSGNQIVRPAVTTTYTLECFKRIDATTTITSEKKSITISVCSPKTEFQCEKSYSCNGKAGQTVEVGVRCYKRDTCLGVNEEVSLSNCSDCDEGMHKQCPIVDAGDWKEVAP